MSEWDRHADEVTNRAYLQASSRRLQTSRIPTPETPAYQSAADLDDHFEDALSRIRMERHLPRARNDLNNLYIWARANTDRRAHDESDPAWRRRISSWSGELQHMTRTIDALMLRQARTEPIDHERTQRSRRELRHTAGPAAPRPPPFWPVPPRSPSPPITQPPPSQRTQPVSDAALQPPPGTAVSVDQQPVDTQAAVRDADVIAEESPPIFSDEEVPPEYTRPPPRLRQQSRLDEPPTTAPPARVHTPPLIEEDEPPPAPPPPRPQPPAESAAKKKPGRPPMRQRGPGFTDWMMTIWDSIQQPPYHDLARRLMAAIISAAVNRLPLPPGISYIAGQLEEGANSIENEQDRPHAQIVVQLSEPTESYTEAVRILMTGFLNDPNAPGYAEPVRSIFASRQYVLKNATRADVSLIAQFLDPSIRDQVIIPTIDHYGTINTVSTTKQWEAINEAIKLGAQYDDILKMYPRIAIQYSIGIQKAIQQLEKPAKKREMEVWLYWGLTGSGKTHTALMNNGESVYSKMSGDWWEGYEGEDVVIFDEFTGKDCSLPELLQILGGWQKKVPIKHSYRHLRAKKIILTSNWFRDTWYPTAQKENLNALKRRLPDEHCLFFYEQGKDPIAGNPQHVAEVLGWPVEKVLSSSS